MDDIVISKPKPRVVAVIPCYNTAPHIAEVVTKTLSYVNQVIVVDDGLTYDLISEARLAGVKVMRELNKLFKRMGINGSGK